MVLRLRLRLLLLIHLHFSYPSSSLCNPQSNQSIQLGPITISTTTSTTSVVSALHYSCPSSLVSSTLLSLQDTTTNSTTINNDNNNNWDDETLLYVPFYEQPSTKLLQAVEANLTQYLQVYRKVSFDNWGTTYQAFQQGLRPWKVRHFLPAYLSSLSSKDDDALQHSYQDEDPAPPCVFRIYESASGIGLNLALTAEILHQEITHVSPSLLSLLPKLELHGNDYVASSVAVARRLYQQGRLVQPYNNATLGQCCTASSTNLQHVPSNAFDVVFTGYITPLMDPLSLFKANNNKNQKQQQQQPVITSKDDMDQVYAPICQENNNNNNNLMIAQMQHAQEAYYATWVAEMIRIAKPGAPIMIESVSLPYCEARFDWGGVSRDFWKRYVAQTAGMNATSLDFAEDQIYQARYHVYFRKNIMG